MVPPQGVDKAQGTCPSSMAWGPCPAQTSAVDFRWKSSVQHWLETKLSQSVSKLKKRIVKTLGVEQQVAAAWIATFVHRFSLLSLSLFFLMARQNANAGAMADVSPCHSTADLAA